jgi:hypothetical protein
MANLWNITSHSEDRLILERGPQRMEIEKPEDPIGLEAFMKLVNGSTVSDIGVDFLTRHKKEPNSVKESDAGAVPHSGRYTGNRSRR